MSQFVLELREFGIRFGERVLLDCARLQCEAGTLTALIGRNGSGKSSLLRCLSGASRAYRGSISIDGHDLRELSAPELARLMAVVTTERIAMPRCSAYDVAALGRAPYTGWYGTLGERDRQIVAQALEATGTAHLAARMFDSLSDGEARRVLIARAMAQDTPVILLDEPTSFLDLPGRHQLGALLRRLADEQGRCIVYSTHELDVAQKQSHRICLIDTPQLVCDAPQALSPHISRVFGI